MHKVRKSLASAPSDCHSPFLTLVHPKMTSSESLEARRACWNEGGERPDTLNAGPSSSFITRHRTENLHIRQRNGMGIIAELERGKDSIMQASSRFDEMSTLEHSQWLNVFSEIGYRRDEQDGR